MAKCKICKGEGVIRGNTECPVCEGLGVPLRSTIEEQYDEATEIDGTKLHNGEVGFIEFEEDDYEI